MQKIITDQNAENQRLDQWLTQFFAGRFSRARIQALIKAGCVRIGQESVCEPKRKLHAGQEVFFDLPPLEEAEPLAQEISLEVLYEDEFLLVINKPAGLVVHPGNGNPDGTLVNALLFHCQGNLSGIGGVKRPGIVHRLDKNTSGVMVVAKNDKAHMDLSQQFADHGRLGHLERRYIALVWGDICQKKSPIETYLGRSRLDRTKRTTVPQGRSDAKKAITHFSPLEAFSYKKEAPLSKNEILASLVECRLETGRTHQIRVHMAHIGHPLIGDDVYGAGFKSKMNKFPAAIAEKIKRFPRQALHAASLKFEHPETKEILSFTVPCPPDMQDLLNHLRSLTTI